MTERKHKGPFLILNTKEDTGREDTGHQNTSHEETYVYFRGQLIHKRWRPGKREEYGRIYGKYGTCSW